MDREEAARLLGVHPEGGPDEWRAAYRRLLLAHHPDHSAHGDAGRTTRALIDAYRVLRRSADAPAAAVPAPATPPPPAPSAPPPAAEVAQLSDDTLSLACPSDEAFARLVEVGHRIGDVTYVDRVTGMLEVLVRTGEGHALSLVTSLQGRANGCTEVFVTLEPVGVPDVPVPPVAEATALLAHHLAVGRTG